MYKFLVSLLFIACVSYAAAQTKFNPATQINWPTGPAGCVYEPGNNTCTGTVTPPAPTGVQALYLMNAASGTTETDLSGNNGPCTFGVLPPVINTSGAVPYLTFNASANSVMTCPASAFNGAQTVEVWYNQRNVTGLSGNGALIGTDVGNHTGLQVVTSSSGWGSPLEWYNTSNVKVVALADRAVGPTGLAVTLGTNPLMYLNGRSGVAYKNISTGIFNAFSATSTVTIGMLQPTQYGNNYNGDLYAIIVRAGIATPAQLQADNTYVVAQMLVPNGLAESNAVTSPLPALLDTGDSIQEGEGVVYVWYSTIPYFEAAQLDNGFDIYNMGVSGQQISTEVGVFATSVTPEIQAHYNAGTIVANAAGTNDIANGLTAGQVETSITSYANAVHAAGAKFVWENIIPRYTFTTAQQTAATAVNTWALGQMQLATPLFDGLSDRAGTPWETTTKANSVAFNTQCTPDGTHGSAFCNQQMAYANAVAVSYAAHPSQPFLIPVTIPYQVLTAAATTQTVNLYQLLPSQKVCGIRLPPPSGTTTGYGSTAPRGITTAFAGTSITGVTLASFGDSVGPNATAYGSPAASLTVTTSTWDGGAPTFVSTNGIVTATITSTGANLSALTAGSVTVTLEVCPQ